MSTVLLMLGVGVMLASAAAPALAADIRRSDFRVTTADGVGIQLRELRPANAGDGAPLILVHGARVPGLASFDLEVPGGSFGADLAERLRRVVYIMDARGYGGSDRPDALSRPAKESKPLSRAHEVVRDIHAAVQAVQQRSGANRVALLGWATGGMWCAYYASLWPDNVSHLVTLNALYGGNTQHSALGPDSANADPNQRHRFNPATGGYAIYDAASLFPGWDRSIPVPDKASWRDPAVADAYGRAALASDPTSPSRTPAAFRAPLGAIEDSFYQASGRRLFDAGAITAATLVVRSELDFWSRPEDADAFVRDAGRARSVTLLTLPGATHFVHLERPDKGRARLLDEIAQLLDAP
ncbi:alpha/beta fold hydrolase [Reyranella soli]|uniref:Alpha/beta hydrolase n=1 Tax=Reyranella soli TaxID=1230389 RepID=A0A512N4D0_9HYPH|nr:alpha/beta fold hydrolase [Reyranella soli]GEP53481.1 alpha/beta hydrolase [Reyranella soli]